MIRLTYKTRQDFLDKEWSDKFAEARFPMGDNKYWIAIVDGTEYITEDKTLAEQMNYECYPTYTLSELQLKLGEWHPEYKALKLGGPIMWKDAPFYFAQYENAPDNSPYVCFNEFPLYAAAQLALNCVKNGFGVVQDVSDK